MGEFGAYGALGGHANIDFYEVTPRDVHLSAQLKDPGRIRVSPVARVLLTTDEVKALFDQCQTLVDEVGPLVADKEAL